MYRRGNHQAARLARILIRLIRMTDHEPAALVQVGVGVSPEAGIFRRHFPSLRIVGMDPNAMRDVYPGEYYRVAIADYNGQVAFQCRRRGREDVSSVYRSEQGGGKVDCRTLDYMMCQIALTRKPICLWMDCEGSEFSAMKGGRQTLAQSDWVYVENVSDADLTDGRRAAGWPPAHCVRDVMESAGFEIAGEYGCDLVYVRTGIHRRRRRRDSKAK